MQKMIIAVIMLVIILCTNSVASIMFGATQIEIGLCLIGLFFIFVNKNTDYNIGVFYSYVIFLCLLTLLQYIIYPENIFHWLRLVLLFIVMTHISIYTITRSINVAEIYYRLILFMCIISTAVYFPVEIGNMDIPHSTLSVDWLPTYDVYYYVYCSMQIDLGTETFMGFSFKRNCGYFTEPGLYAFFIVSALFIFLFLKKKKTKWELVVWLTTLLTTFSTTGLILTVIIVAYYFNSRNIKTIFVRIGFASLSIVAVVYIITDLLAAKQVEHANSFTSRMIDLIGGIKLFCEQPLLGYGYKNFDVFNSYSLQFFPVERNNSNGVVSALYQLGLIGCSIFYIPFIYVRKKIKHHKSLFTLYTLVLIVLMMGEPIQYTTTGACIIGYIMAAIMTRKKVELTFI